MTSSKKYCSPKSLVAYSAPPKETSATPEEIRTHSDCVSRSFHGVAACPSQMLAKDILLNSELSTKRLSNQASVLLFFFPLDSRSKA